MALVAYDYDSNSENEEESDSEATSSSVIIPPAHKTDNIPVNNINGHNSVSDSSVSCLDKNSADTNTERKDSDLGKLLSNLPKSRPQVGNESEPSTKAKVAEDTLEDFIPKYQPPKEKGHKVKITIPSLAQFTEEEEDDDGESKSKKLKPSGKGSSLLSLLPPVKGEIRTTTSFVPNTLKNKPSAKPIQSSTTTSLVPNNVRRKAELAKKAALEKIMKGPGKKTSAAASDESDDDTEVPETFDEDMWQKVCGRPAPKKTPVVAVSDQTSQIFEPPEETVNSAPVPDQPYEGLDNKAFKELVGKSKRPMNIKLIDINEEEILPDKDLWRTKSLTDPEHVPKAAIDDPVDPTRKRKHHITYLAEQAKANEQELQNQWSANKFSRNSTRAKYGF